MPYMNPIARNAAALWNFLKMIPPARASSVVIDLSIQNWTSDVHLIANMRDQCVGNLPADIIAQREDLLKDRVAIEMKRYFRNDFKRIGHASRVARHAEHIGKAEKGNLAVILTAAYLHDIGILEAERKYKSSSPRYQHIEGPPIASEILRKLNAKEELIEEVSDIVGHHHNTPRKEENNQLQSCI